MEEREKTINQVCTEIIDELQGEKPLTADAACQLIERLDVEVIARGAPAELGYSLLYELAECLALRLQEHGALGGDIPCK